MQVLLLYSHEGGKNIHSFFPLICKAKESTGVAAWHELANTSEKLHYHNNNYYIVIMRKNKWLYATD
jgi:hypothetical protein